MGNESSTTQNGSTSRPVKITKADVETTTDVQARLDTFTFRWNICNFDFAGNVNTKMISEAFIGGKVTKHKWCVTIVPKRNWFLDLINSKAVGLHLNLMEINKESNQKSVPAKFTIQFLDSNGVEIGRFGSHFHGFVAGGGFGWNLRELPSKVSREIDSKRELRMQITVSVLTNRSDGIAVKFGVNNEASTKQLTSTFKQLLDSSYRADVSLISSSGKTFKAHKCLLGCRSTVFAAMFASVEYNMDKVDMKGFTGDVIKGMLQFVYCGQVSDLRKNGLEYLKIAEMYQLDGLKRMSECVLAQSLTVENAIDVWHFADLHNGSLLKDETLKFINKNKSAISRNNWLKTVTNAALLRELYLLE